MLLSEAMQEWLTFLADHDGKSRKTIHDYRSHLQALARPWGPQATVDAFTLHALRVNLDAYEQRCRPRSVAARIQALRSFGTWLMMKGLLTTNPAVTTTAPPLDDPVRRWPSDARLLALVKACDSIADAQRAALTRALLLTCIHTGLRTGEVTALKLSDADLSRGILHVRHGKGNKPRLAYPHEDCIVALRAWLAIRPQDCRHDWLFAIDRGRRVSEDGLRTLFATVKLFAGFAHDKDLTPHCFRRAYATRLLKNGANLDEIRQALGHSSVYTTGMYLYSSEAQMRRLSELSSLQPDKEAAAVPESHLSSKADWKERTTRPARRHTWMR